MKSAGGVLREGGDFCDQQRVVEAARASGRGRDLWPAEQLSALETTIARVPRSGQRASPKLRFMA